MLSFFFFKQKTAYEMRISDWSSDVCSSDLSKAITADFRHRALRHHAEGIFMLERFFGATITASTGRVVPVRLIGEQHVREDLGFIPSFADWVRCIRPEPWMGRAQPIHRSVDPFAITADDPDRRPERPNLRVIGASS